MSEAAAPAAPAAPSSDAAPTNGASLGDGQPAARVEKTVLPQVKGARANNGQFLPKEGNQQPGDAKAADAPWRYKDTLNVFGEKEEVDYDQETVRRNMQKLRAYEKKQIPELQQNDARARRLLEIAKADPDGFLRELGHDPIAFARKRLAEEARLGAMTEEEKAIHERDKRIAEYEAKDKERAEQEKTQKAEATKGKLVETLKAKVGSALKMVAPALGDNYEAFEAVVWGLKTQLAGGATLKDLTPEEIAKDAISSNHTKMRAWASSMDGPTLAKELGPKALANLLDHSIAEWDKSQSFEAHAQPRGDVLPDAPKEREFLTSAEVERRMRLLK